MLKQYHYNMLKPTAAQSWVETMVYAGGHDHI